jgi:DNA-binding NarL/FixJ family response regulator
VIVSDSTQIGCEVLANALAKCPERFRVLECCTRYSSLIAAMRKNSPTVTLVVSKLEDGESGLRVLRQAQSEACSTRTMLLVDTREREVVVDSFRAGAKGVFFRGQPFALLRKAIRAVAQGQIWAGHVELEYILDALLAIPTVRLTDATGSVLLTKREEQVVLQVTKGLSNREISQELGLSEHTVKNYLFRIFDKLGVSSRAELILYVVQKHQMPFDRGAA